MVINILQRFYLAGNPKEEHPESQEKSRSGQHDEEGNYNVFSGFDPKFLAEVLNSNEGLAKKLQCLHGQRERDQIIEVKRGLSIIIPPLEREEGEEEGREHEHGRKRGEEEEEEQQPRTRERRRKEGEGGKEEVVEKKETRTRERKEGGEGEEVVEKKETRTRESSEGGRRRRRHGQGEGEEEQQERGREEHREWRQREKEEEEEGSETESNALQEDVCTLKLHENIANPSRADFFNPTAGRISTVNSLTLPLLKWLQLSAEWVNLYKVPKSLI